MTEKDNAIFIFVYFLITAKPLLTNGGSSKSYTTRAATGSIKPRKYCADGSFTDEDKNQENSHSSSDSDSETNLNEKSRPQSSSSSSSSSSHHSHNNSSGSDTESLNSDYKTVQSAPTVRVPNHRRKPRLKANIKGEEGAGTSDNRRRPKRSTKQIETFNGSEGPVRSTRNKGKRTIKYTQESDLEEDQSESGSNSDTEESEPSTPVVTVSSRGRLRKMTPRARANLAS